MPEIINKNSEQTKNTFDFFEGGDSSNKALTAEKHTDGCKDGQTDEQISKAILKQTIAINIV